MPLVPRAITSPATSASTARSPSVIPSRRVCPKSASRQAMPSSPAPSARATSPSAGTSCAKGSAAGGSVARLAGHPRRPARSSTASSNESSSTISIGFVVVSASPRRGPRRGQSRWRSGPCLTPASRRHVSLIAQRRLENRQQANDLDGRRECGRRCVAGLAVASRSLGLLVRAGAPGAAVGSSTRRCVAQVDADPDRPVVQVLIVVRELGAGRKPALERMALHVG